MSYSKVFSIQRLVSFYFKFTSVLDKQGNTENTRSPVEVEKFSSLSSQWWNKSGEFVPLKALNRLRVPLVKNVLLEGRQKPITKPLRELKILDVGCGGGLLSEVRSLCYHFF